MNLEKIKELEDIKKELQNYDEKYNSLLNNKIHEYIVNAEREFTSFFKEKGFSINETTKEIQAVYGNSQINIDKFNEEEGCIGFCAVWHMDCQINKSKYRILLNKLGHYPTITISFSSIGKLSEDEEINKEINDKKQKIQRLKEKFDEFDSVKFGYGLINEREKIVNEKYPQFQTMKQLLESLFS